MPDLACAAAAARTTPLAPIRPAISISTRVIRLLTLPQFGECLAFMSTRPKRRRRLGNKKPGPDAGLFVFLPIDSAEDAGCVDATRCRKQSKGDQNKFHDLPPSRLQYSSGLSGRNPFRMNPAGTGPNRLLAAPK